MMLIFNNDFIFKALFVYMRLTVANDNKGIFMDEKKQAYDEVARVLYGV